MAAGIHAHLLSQALIDFGWGEEVGMLELEEEEGEEEVEGTLGEEDCGKRSVP